MVTIDVEIPKITEFSDVLVRTVLLPIGDDVGQLRLGLKEVHERKVVAEVATDKERISDAAVIPSVPCTDSEAAWVGMTEVQALDQGISYGKSVFPCVASGRLRSLGRSEGITKLSFDENDGRLIGAGIVGRNAGDLTGEAAVAIEKGANVTDLGQTIQAHPTLSETLHYAVEMYRGTITDPIPQKRKGSRT